ncbi:MAG: hypothetical protein P8M20_11205 [Planctomycetaceae bacterium]|nr:hypothetical protein [Planctomycetaceae bacterium]
MCLDALLTVVFVGGVKTFSPPLSLVETAFYPSALWAGVLLVVSCFGVCHTPPR